MSPGDYPGFPLRCYANAMYKSNVLALAGLFAAALALADGAYKWVDADGVVHYSDRPRAGAEEVDLDQYSGTTGVQLATGIPPRRAANADDEESAGPAFRYENVSVTAPAAEETLWNIGGVLNVTVSMTPSLQGGHQVRIYFDGAPRMVDGTRFQIEEVYRGVHNIQAEIIDSAGKTIGRSNPSRFYVQQNTLITRPGG